MAQVSLKDVRNVVLTSPGPAKRTALVAMFKECGITVHSAVRANTDIVVC